MIYIMKTDEEGFFHRIPQQELLNICEKLSV